MNNWMADPFEYPTKAFDRGKVLNAEDLERLGKFERYKDVDGDGIPQRTLPGTPHPLAAYFTRGSGHTEKATYTEKPEDYVNLMDRLNRKFDSARTYVPQPVIDVNAKAKVGVIAFGSTHFAIYESRDQLAQANLPTSYFRLRALPFNEELRKFVESHDRVYVVEQNRDGQLRDLIILEIPDLATKIRSVRHYDGLPIDARFVTDAILEQEK
jgi:2-oxoglutarate ferredoxin oxidoreductase subunit alpha